LLLRNLHELFGEIDPARRRARSTKSSTKTSFSIIPTAFTAGLDEINRIAGVIPGKPPAYCLNRFHHTAIAAVYLFFDRLSR
jgi:hypothetical protein